MIAEALEVLGPVDWRRATRVLRARPHWPLELLARLVGWLWWCWQRERPPSFGNCPLRLVALWPEPAPTAEQISNFNTALREVREDLERSRLKLEDRLRTLVQENGA